MNGTAVVGGAAARVASGIIGAEARGGAAGEGKEPEGGGKVGPAVNINSRSSRSSSATSPSSSRGGGGEGDAVGVNGGGGGSVAGSEGLPPAHYQQQQQQQQQHTEHNFRLQQQQQQQLPPLSAAHSGHAPPQFQPSPQHPLHLQLGTLSASNNPGGVAHPMALSAPPGVSTSRGEQAGGAGLRSSME